MSRSLAEVLERRDLLLAITWREIKVKYKQSVMGMLWALLMPMVIIAAGIVVRFGFSMVSGTKLQMSDVASVSVRAVPWAFFVSSLRFATTSLTSNTSLVTKIYLPREIFPVAAVLSQLVDFVVAGVVLLVVLAVLGVGVSVHLLWVPLLIGLLVAISMGLGLLFSAASLFFRDVKYLVEVGLTFAIFFTPVLYDTRVFERFATVLMFNPLSAIFEGLSDVVVGHTMPRVPWLGYSAAWALAILVLALYAFRRLEPYFAESV